MKTAAQLLAVAIAIGGLMGTIEPAAAATATDCTIFVSSIGKDTNSGSMSAPQTLVGADKASVPGSVICLRAGTYNMSQPFRPTKRGTASKWIVYKNFGEGEVHIQWTGTSQVNMFHFYSTALNSTTAPIYIEVQGLWFFGKNVATVALKCDKTHHLRFINNRTQDIGVAGIASVGCDYVVADGNQISHTGYGQGWASGISLNSNQWSDRYPGFHSVVVNNIISGGYDNSTHLVYGHTDGNGVIMDRSSPTTTDFSASDTPPVLIANNVVYENGEYCVFTWSVSNIWVLNNTCYKNSLDLKMHLQHSPGELSSSNSKNGYFLNNLAYAWHDQKTYMQNATQDVIFSNNLQYGGVNSFPTVKNLNPVLADPQFVGPPVVDPTKDGQYATALAPWLLGDALKLKPTSPAIDAGFDPTTYPNVPPEIIAGLKQYVYKDIDGVDRPQGKAFDLGAYEYPSKSVPPVPPSPAPIPPCVPPQVPSCIPPTTTPNN